MVIDSHRHFWRYTDAEFGWITDASIRRDFQPGDCAGMDPCIAVEARQSIEETETLLEFASRYDFIKGVVGWLPVASPDFGEILSQYEGSARLVGLRHVVQDEPDDAFILRKDFVRGVKHLLARGFSYDILVFERQLANAMAFTDLLPDDARLVLDHFGKPASFNTWRSLVKELAKRENVHCKLSGLVTEIGATADPEPYLDTALEAFGSKRVMFGSDWPVVTATIPYEKWRSTVLSYAEKLSPGECEDVMGGNALRFYNA